ncbi:MAG: Uma2 family endonuclease [Conchiformibius sp.]|nr:Uma2 family endonuclease [Conchiformibius sp.]
MNAFPQMHNRVSEAEYLAYCATQPEGKFELIDGEIVAMAGASLNHNLLTMNFAALLHGHLADSGCFTFVSDWKVQVGSNYYYPDVVVDCLPQEGRPKLIIEVLSESTRHTDLSIKLEDYQTIPDLLEYVAVEQNAQFIVVYRRKQAWRGEVYQKGEVFLESIGLSLSLEQIYHRVAFERKKLNLLRK